MTLHASKIEPGSRAAGASASDDAHPLTRLSRDDLTFITELVLQSGSLKGLAKSYGVSYPTIRSRLDRVIERTRLVLSGQPRDPVRELLADLVERGQLAPGAAVQILDTVSKESTRARNTEHAPIDQKENHR